eukprot:ANDGO_07105.mRNA.1 Guanine nucleotide-binding protein subunit beta
MSTVGEKLAQAHVQARQLKEQIKQIKLQTNDADLATKANSLEPIKLTFTQRRKLEGHSAKVNSFAWGCDSRHMLSASHDGFLVVWDAMTKFKMYCIPLRCNWVMSCAYADNLSLVASGGLDNICSIFSLKRTEDIQRPIKELQAHTGYVSCMKFLTDRHIITGSGDMTCILWDVETGKISNKYIDHAGDVTSISISPDKKYFISGSVDQTAKLWDTRSSKCVQTFTGHGGDVNSVSYLPSGMGFATGSEDGTCKLFDIRADRDLATYRTGKDAPSSFASVCFSYSGRLLFGGCDDFNLYAWDTLRGELVYANPVHDDRVTGVSVSPDGFALATSSWDNNLKIWTAELKV